MATTLAPGGTSQSMSQEDIKAYQLFRRALDAAEKPHIQRQHLYRKRDDIYNAVLKPKDNKWRHDLHPPYALQIVEIFESNIVEERPIWRINPLAPEYEEGAKALEALLAKQMSLDRFAQKQVFFVRQALIRGLAAAKISWMQEQRYVMSQEAGPFTPPQRRLETVKSQPTFTNIDVNDIMWDPAAVDAEDANYFLYRTYDTIDALKAMEALGVYRNVNLVTPGDYATADKQSGRWDDRDLRGRVEVMECWWRDRLITVANRKIVLRDDENPYYHGCLPFVFATTLPRLFRIDGKSEVEIVQDIQAALWKIQNQRLDNVELINNAAYLIREGIDDADAFDVYPGAVIAVADPNSIKPLSPDPNILQPAIQAEEVLKGDLSNLSGAVAMLSGADQTTVDVNTATGISMIQNMAAKRILRKKQQIQWAYRDAGMQFVYLNQQCLSHVEQVRLDLASNGQWTKITNDMIQGNYDFDVEDISEALNRQEKRIEATTKAQFFLGNAQGLAMMGVQLDLRKVIQDYTEAWGDPPDKFLVPTLPQPSQTIVPGSSPTPQIPPNMTPPGATMPVTNATNGVVGPGPGMQGAPPNAPPTAA